MKTPKQVKDATMIAAYSFAAAAVLVFVYAAINVLLLIKNYYGLHWFNY
jgi:hypothetical protein